MRLVLISDTHTQLDKIDIPEGDILIHAGDATYDGNIVRQVASFNRHLGAIKHKFKHVIFSPGNHDFMFEDEEVFAKGLITNAHTIVHGEIIIDGLKIFGSPWTPWFYSWAFNFPENDDNGEIARAFWADIPEDTDILITHGPPHRMLDKVGPNGHSPRKNGDKHVGCPWLAERIKELPKLKLHVFGHIHEGYGKVVTEQVTFVNASSCNIHYKPVNPPIVVDI